MYVSLPSDTVCGSTPPPGQYFDEKPHGCTFDEPAFEKYPAAVTANAQVSPAKPASHWQTEPPPFSATHCPRPAHSFDM